MISFTLAQQVDIRNAITSAVREALEEISPGDLSVRVLTSSIEFSALQPAGMGLNIRLSVQVNQKDKKETVPA